MQPPTRVRRAHPENVALVPGSLLPLLKRYQGLLGRTLEDELVFVLPDAESRQKTTVRVVAQLLQASGHRVQLIEEHDLMPPKRGAVVQDELGI